jgi:hypothetical protein
LQDRAQELRDDNIVRGSELQKMILLKARASLRVQAAEKQVQCLKMSGSLACVNAPIRRKNGFSICYREEGSFLHPSFQQRCEMVLINYLLPGEATQEELNHRL